MKREMQMMDKTTIHFVVHMSCWEWYNLRMFYTVKLVLAAGIVLCLTMKGKMSKVILSMVLTYTMDLDWVQHLFGCYAWLERNLIDCEKLFNLQRVVQEKTKGTVQVKEDWVTGGKIEFKDVVLRYRKNA